MSELVGKKQFEMSVTSMREAISRVAENRDPERELVVVYLQCDVLKASAIAYATELATERARRDGR